MAKELGGITLLAAESFEQARELVGRLFSVAHASAAFGKPVEVGDRVVIPASEATVSMGFGVGLGGDGDQAGGENVAGDGVTSSEGAGGGAGGGGFAGSRPVAVVSAGPDGVRVEPVVDVTKIALAMFTSFAAVLTTLARTRRIARG